MLLNYRGEKLTKLRKLHHSRNKFTLVVLFFHLLNETAQLKKTPPIFNSTFSHLLFETAPLKKNEQKSTFYIFYHEFVFLPNTS